MAAIRVRITRTGFIGSQVRLPGEELTLAHKRYFSDKWMELLGPVPEAPTEQKVVQDAPAESDDPGVDLELEASPVKPKRSK